MSTLPNMDWAAKLRELMNQPRNITTEAQFEAVVDEICLTILHGANVFVYNGAEDSTPEFMAEFEAILKAIQYGK